MPIKNKKMEKSEKIERVAFFQASRNRKYLGTLVVCYCTFAYGMGSTFLGPAVTDFSNKFNVEIDDVAPVFSILTGTYLVGALANGIVNKFVHRQLLVVILMSMGSASLFIFPYVGTLGLFFMLAAFLGFFGGGYDSIQVAWVIDIWRNEAAPFILIQHFSYSVGAVIPPLLQAPFLDGETPSTASTTTSTEGSSVGSSSTEEYEDEESQMWIPFSVAGCIVAIGIVIQIVSYFTVFRLSPSAANTSMEKKESDEEKIENPKKEAKKFKFKFPGRRELILIILTCFGMAFDQALELGTMGFLPTFAHHSTLKLSESDSAQVLFGLTIACCICRFIGIFLVLKVRPHLIVFGNIVILIVSNLILLFWGDDDKTMLWVGSVLMGAGWSTAFPAYFAYIEKYLFISDTVSSVLLVFCGGISALYPIVVGNSVEHNPKIMIYANFLCLAVFAAGFSITFWLTYFKWNTKKQSVQVDSEINDGNGDNNNTNEGEVEKY